MTSLKPTAGEFQGTTHVLPIRVYYEDTDFTGLVYHGAYVRWFERGRSDFLRLAGVNHAELLDRDDPLGFVVTRMSIEFRKGARIDDALVARTSYDSLRGPRVFVTQSIERDGELLASAEVQVVCIDMAGRPRKPPATLLARIKPLLRTPTP